MSDNDTEKIGNYLTAKNQDGKTDKLLEFDPISGELVVREPSERRNPDATAVDQIAADGFA